MGFLAKIFNGFKPSTIFLKSSILNVWENSQTAITFSKLTTETLEQLVKYIQIYSNMFLLLTLSRLWIPY